MMSNLIVYPAAKPAQQSINRWQTLTAEAATTPLPSNPVLVPFAHWQQVHTQAALQPKIQTAEVGVWLSSDSDLTSAANDLFATLPSDALIAIDFPIFRDGRGFSLAALLRQRFNWQGELRAIGDVLIDQLLPMARVGFDSFELRADQDIVLALAQFDSFRYRLQTDWRTSRSQLNAKELSQ